MWNFFQCYSLCLTHLMSDSKRRVNVQKSWTVQPTLWNRTLRISWNKSGLQRACSVRTKTRIFLHWSMLFFLRVFFDDLAGFFETRVYVFGFVFLLSRSLQRRPIFEFWHLRGKFASRIKTTPSTPSIRPVKYCHASRVEKQLCGRNLIGHFSYTRISRFCELPTFHFSK